MCGNLSTGEGQKCSSFCINNTTTHKAVMNTLDFRSLNAFFSIDGPDSIEVLWDQNYFQSPPKGYVGWNKGIPHTEETKIKISEATKGRIPHNKNISHTEETKRKISEANKGKTSYWKGKKQPKDAVEKMKQTLKGTRVGENNSKAKTYKITFDDGTSVIIKSLETWANENGYNPTSLRNLYNGKNKSRHKNVISVTLVELSTTT